MCSEVAVMLQGKAVHHLYVNGGSMTVMVTISKIESIRNLI